eukprot:gene4181-5159_t
MAWLSRWESGVVVESKKQPELKATLAEALCSLAELLLNHSEELEKVQEEAESLVKAALEADPSSPEPLQVMASLRNEQGRSEEALQSLRASLAMWMHLGEGDPMTAEAELPSYEFRCETVKLLLDLDDTTEVALSVLDSMLMEDDSNPDVWYLNALAHHGACHFDEAKECIESGLKVVAGLSLVDPELAGAKTAEFQELCSAVEESKLKMEEEDEEEEEEDEDEDMGEDE